MLRHLVDNLWLYINSKPVTVFTTRWGCYIAGCRHIIDFVWLKNEILSLPGDNNTEAKKLTWVRGKMSLK